MHDARNVGQIERLLSVGSGALMVAIAVRRRDLLAVAVGGLGAYLIYRGATGVCPLYAKLGVDSSVRFDEHNPRAAVPYGRGVRIEESITIVRPAGELYDFWRLLETLPEFMDHLEEVTTLTDTRSRWRVRAPIGARATWEAEIVNDVPGELIAWRSLPGSPIHHAGSVHFEEYGGLTTVRVVLEYAPPARYVGASIARIFGEDPQRQVAEDLQRFKGIVERGERAKSQ